MDFPATVIVPGQELIMTGAVRDLSGGGIRIATTSDLPAGQPVVVRFVLPESTNGEILVRGRIVLSYYEGATKTYAHGIAFTQYAEPDQKAIVSYVESHPR